MKIQNSKFDELENNLINSNFGDFNRIHSMLDLYNEGNNQHNCVFTRRNAIRNDSISIFHWDYLDKNYTIQFSMDSFQHIFKVDEIRAKYNEVCKTEILGLLSDILWKVNIKKYSLINAT